MPDNRKNFTWVLLHLTVIGLTLTSLLTGLRIATLSHSELMRFNALLPQGYLHGLHLYSAIGLISVSVGYIVYLIMPPKKGSEALASTRFHRIVIDFGRVVMLMSIISGILLYLGVFSSALLHETHYWSALSMLTYLGLHIGGHFVQYGVKAFNLILFPGAFVFKKEFAVFASAPVVFVLLFFLSDNRAYHLLSVKQIPLTTLINIDGLANEAVWNDAEAVVINTFAGVNFEDGESKVTVKAVQNGYDLFFHFSWDDPTKSLQHLPLVKGRAGWKVMESGFYRFDENKYYEDKFAVMISTNCEPGASKTVHLGPKPIADKPGNWHGKGYHYAEDGKVRDLWHWKAVRTNDMRLADDNFIGQADVIRDGLRRYSAGYQADGKESGGYDANWQWYTPDGVTPKLLPKQPAQLDAYQKSSNDSAKLNWVIPWFDYDLYNPEKDVYPPGTVMPSVLYVSNRFEGDRANVQARAEWHEGKWSLETARSLDTGSAYDVVLDDGVCVWVSAFDHAQVAHTRHVLPIRLTFGDFNG